MKKSIRQLVDRFYGIVNGDEGDFSEIFSKDFSFDIMKGFPYGGKHVGLKKINKFFDDLGEKFEFWDVETDKFIQVDDNKIVVTGKYISKCNDTGKSFEMETVHLWESKDGMLTSYKHFCDTAILSNAMNNEVPQYN